MEDLKEIFFEILRYTLVILIGITTIMLSLNTLREAKEMEVALIIWTIASYAVLLFGLLAAYQAEFRNSIIFAAALMANLILNLYKDIKNDSKSCLTLLTITSWVFAAAVRLTEDDDK